MKCINHNNIDATSQCKSCGSFICNDCISNVVKLNGDGTNQNMCENCAQSGKAKVKSDNKSLMLRLGLSGIGYGILLLLLIFVFIDLYFGTNLEKQYGGNIGGVFAIYSIFLIIYNHEYILKIFPTFIPGFSIMALVLFISIIIFGFFVGLFYVYIIIPIQALYQLYLNKKSGV